MRLLQKYGVSNGKVNAQLRTRNKSPCGGREGKKKFSLVKVAMFGNRLCFRWEARLLHPDSERKVNTQQTKVMNKQNMATNSQVVVWSPSGGRFSTQPGLVPASFFLWGFRCHAWGPPRSRQQLGQDTTTATWGKGARAKRPSKFGPRCFLLFFFRLGGALCVGG